MLRQCIESRRNQTTKPLEIIVVDDGLTDATTALASEFPPVIRYVAKRNEGKAAALNFALPLAGGARAGTAAAVAGGGFLDQAGPASRSACKDLMCASL